MLIAAFVLTIGMMSVLGDNNPAVIDLGFIGFAFQFGHNSGYYPNLILPIWCGLSKHGHVGQALYLREGLLQPYG